MHRPLVALLVVLSLTRCQCVREALPEQEDGGDPSNVDGGASSGTASSGGSSGTSTSSGGTSSSSGGTSSGGADAGFCAGSGTIVGSTDAGPICGGDLAQVTFRYAICTCEDIALASVLTTDAFDSTAGAYTSPGELGGAVGVNGNYRNLAVSDIGGSLIAGAQVAPIGDHDFRGEVHCGTDAVAAGDIHIFRDTYVGGDIRGIRYIIDGDLHIPAASTVGVAVDAQNVVREPVSVAPPCDCAESDIIDIASFVTQHVSDNDNAAIGLDPDVWNNTIAQVDLTLPCGRYYLTAVRAGAAITIRATGRTAIFIGGDLELAGVLEIVLESPEAEVDIFVAGRLVAAGVLKFGSRDAPARVRTYIAGESDILLAGDLQFGGNLYAPRSVIRAAGPMELYGAIFAKELREAGTVTVHYDKAVLEAGESCGPSTTDDGGIPPDSCESCEDCGNQACNTGTCGACATSDDCCMPLMCVDGMCVPLEG